MPATPQITLNVNLLDLFGAQLGSVSQPAYIRIALCAAGQYLPAIPGTGMAGRIATWPEDIPYLGVAQAIKLWGNDVITPPNTYYMISILDNKRNVIQAVPYQFTGTTTYDLSTASPYGFPLIVPVVRHHLSDNADRRRFIFDADQRITRADRYVHHLPRWNRESPFCLAVERSQYDGRKSGSVERYRPIVHRAQRWNPSPNRRRNLQLGNRQ
jgi:hypothetical protein